MILGRWWRLSRTPRPLTSSHTPEAHLWLLLGASKSNSLSLYGVSSSAELSRAKAATSFDLIRRRFARKTFTASVTRCTASEPLFASAQKGAKNALSVCRSKACTPGRTACLVSFLGEACAPNAPDSASMRRHHLWRLGARTWRRASIRQVVATATWIPACAHYCPE